MIHSPPTTPFCILEVNDVKKFWLFAVALCLVVSLAGCKDQADQDSAAPNTETTGNALESPQTNQTSPIINVTQIPVQEMSEEEQEKVKALEVMKEFSYTFESFYLSYGGLMFYPVNNGTLDNFRSFVTDCAEEFGNLQFDPYSIEVTDWGYGVKISSPLDYYGNNYWAWFQVVPENPTLLKNSLVSPGKDGEVTFKGLGNDYSDGGFGDDDVLFYTYNFDAE